MITPETARDLDVLREYPPIVDTDGEDTQWLRATPCVRLTFVADGNMTDRSGRLDDWLARAADIVRPEVKLYGGAGQQIPSSSRRRPKPTDWALFDGLSDRLAADLQAERASSDPGIPQESGSFFFGDSLSSGHSGTRFFALWSFPWRVTVSLSLGLWREKAEEMDALVEDLAALGDVYDSGGYGFAMNCFRPPEDGWARRLYQPVSERFRLLDLVEPEVWRETKLDSLGAKGVQIAPFPAPVLYPIMPWMLLGKATLADAGIAEQAIRDLSPDVHEVVEHEGGFLLKLWPSPVLGDRDGDSDLSPARAVGRALAPAISAGAERFGRSRIAHIGAPEEREAWYRRFLPPS